MKTKILVLICLFCSSLSEAQIKLSTSYSTPRHQVVCSSFSHDSKYIATGGLDKKIIIWETATGKIYKEFSGLSDFPLSLVFSYDGGYLISGGKDSRVTVWNLQTGKNVILKGHTGDVTSVDISLKNQIASASKDKTIRLWELNGTFLKEMKGHSKEVNSVQFNYDGNDLVSGGADGKVILWDVKSGLPLRRIEAHDGWTRCVAFNYNGTLIASGGDDGKIQIWNSSDGKLQNSIIAHSKWVQSLTFSPDGKYIVSGGHDNYLVMINTATGSIVFHSPRQDNYVLSVAFNSNGKNFVSSTLYSEKLNIWDASALGISNLAGNTEIIKTKPSITWKNQNNITSDKLNFKISTSLRSESELSSVDIYVNDRKFSSDRNIQKGSSGYNIEYEKIIYLNAGVNKIRMTAYNSGGETTSDILSVTYVQPAEPPPPVQVAVAPKTRALISWKTPGNISVTELTAKIKADLKSESEILIIDLYVNNIKVSSDKSFKGTQPGFDISFEKTIGLSEGKNTCKLVAINEAGESISEDLNITYSKPEPVAVTVPAIQPEKKTETATTKILPSDVELLQNLSKVPLNSNRYAVIIGNEDYNSYQTGLQSESNVAFAVNDASAFKVYASTILGIPEENIMLLLNSRAIEMDNTIGKLNPIIKALNGKAEIILFYAGHGFPDEVTKEAYLIPVDVSGSNLKFAIKLKDMYNTLTEFPSNRITVFIDACFSGGAREQGLLSTRGVKIMPKTDKLTGNLVVFAASSGNESALPYKEKQHGMFTYFLLAKLKESEGNITYKELSDFITEQVGVKSVLVNNKPQTPQTNVSPEIANVWQTWRIR